MNTNAPRHTRHQGRAETMPDDAAWDVTQTTLPNPDELDATADDIEDDDEPAGLPEVVSPDMAVFTVSVAARLAGMHPQTLRTYDRLGLVVPQRTKGAGRRYSPRDVQKLRLIQRLSQDEGINLEGIRRIIELTDRLEEAMARIDQLTVLAQQLATGNERLSRVFTAEADGAVWPGRHRRTPKQLTGPGRPAAG